MSVQICAGCRFITTKVVANGAANEFIVTCQNGHEPIFLFTGGKCKDYQPKTDQDKEQK